MSDSYGSVSTTGADRGAPDASGKVDAAKQEAADLKDTATAGAKDVLGTAQEEASAVVGEAKAQVKDLYQQSRRELTDQAGVQQRRIVAGLRSVSDELASMVANSEGRGVASELVHQVSTRVSSAAEWLGGRDPGAVVEEVKRYARRKPGTFILGATIAGIVVGRLTRALASATHDETPTPARRELPPAPAPQRIEPDPWAVTPVAAESETNAPLYAQTASSRPDILREDGDDRPDSV